MKKTMFITSVIMVVVMAIALTTSSLAWFTTAGSATVTTNALTVTAKTTAAAGLQISSAAVNGPFYLNIDLYGSASNVVADMVPAMPYKVDSDATLLSALVNHNFISNTVAGPDYSEDTAVTANSGNGTLYFTKDIWVTTVDTSDDLVVSVDIDWTQDDEAYTSSPSDPVVYVAVLADQNEVVKADRSTPDDDFDWEIMAIFSSNAAATNVNFGKTAGFFQSTDADTRATVAASYTTTALSSFTGVATDALEKCAIDTETEQYNPYGEVKQFRIVVWYDGIALVNANSDFSVDFELTFTGAADTANSGSGD
jgi:hypothetical protein